MSDKPSDEGRYKWAWLDHSTGYSVETYAVKNAIGVVVCTTNRYSDGYEMAVKIAHLLNKDDDA